MKFYRVKPEYDQKYINPACHDENVYIANELFSPREVEGLHLNKAYLEEVDVSAREVYWCFGARFSASERR